MVVVLALFPSFHDSPIQASPDLLRWGLHILSVSGTAENREGMREPIRSRFRVFCFNVIDGDTIEIKTEGKRELLRLAGIDAPEKEGPYTRYEPFSGRSTRFLETLVKGKTVYMELASPSRDRFGRLLGFVFLDNGSFVNGHLIRFGYAKVFQKSRSPYKKKLVGLERNARKRCLGLWSLTCKTKK